MSACRYVEGYGYYLKAHELNCRDKCDGCQPCTHDDHGNPVRHCTARERCTSHLNSSERLTCARCIGKTRGDIAAIVSMSAELIGEAIEDGIESEAANLAGPAADPEACMWRRVAESMLGASLAHDDGLHPLTVLGTWDFMLREDYDQQTNARCTIASAAGYLDGTLGRLAQDERQDWPLFAREVAACRSHLSEVLHLSRRPEKGAPCTNCTAEPALVKHYVNQDTTGASDTWRCPACGASWTEAEYRLWVADDYLDNAEVLTASDIHQVYEVAEGTVRRWANEDPPRVRKRGYDGMRRQLYDVADVKAARDTTTTDVRAS